MMGKLELGIGNWEFGIRDCAIQKSERMWEMLRQAQHDIAQDDKKH